MAADYKNKFPQ